MGIVYVARHGETDENREGILLGQKDVRLNKKGINQAHELGKKMKELDIDLIVSSSLIRAKQTAEIVKSYIHKTVKVRRRLKERDIGVYEGLTLKQVQQKFQKGYTSEMAYNKTPPGGESSQAAQRRVFLAMDGVLKCYRDQNILIIGHSFTLKMINKYFNPDISPSDFFSFQLRNGEVRQYES